MFMTKKFLSVVAAFLVAVGASVGAAAQAANGVALPLTFVCRPHNDLFRVMSAAGHHYPRFISAMEAVHHARTHSAVLILASGYPNKTTVVSPQVFSIAKRKHLRLYIEYPASLPGRKLANPRKAHAWERVVISSRDLGTKLPRLRLLTTHGGYFVPTKAKHPAMVLARVAGFEHAVFGLPKQVTPVLFRIQGAQVVVGTTKLSHFVTGRYAPAAAWGQIWEQILGWLCPGKTIPTLHWTPTVHPTYSRSAELPGDAERQALRRGVNWYIHSKVLLNKARLPMVLRLMKGSAIAPPPSPSVQSGNGSLGVLQGYGAKIGINGRQAMSVARRSDCNTETAMSLAFGGKVFGQPQKLTMARHILKFWYDKSGAFAGARGKPNNPAYGLCAWGIDTPGWLRPNFGDDNARMMLGTLAAEALTGEFQQDHAVTRCLLANLRTSGQFGFRYGNIDVPDLEKNGWEYYFRQNNVFYSPHFESYLWACFLWAYHETGDKLLLNRAETAIRMTMAAYPNQWHWTNGMQQERARMLLPLAWLVRVDDTPEHRRWLKMMTEQLLKFQQPCGAIQEQIGPIDHGMMRPPSSNAAYGTGEAPLIQKNGDPVCDMLYTTNFALLGLHEAAAATGNPYYRHAENKLAKFLCRIQVKSASDPTLSGAWYRAFDYKIWDYWASDSDPYWGAWSIETGWTQSWITSVLAMRQLHTSLWTLCNKNHIAGYYKKERPVMIPPKVVATLPKPRSIKDAAIGATVHLDSPPASQYAAQGSVSLTDGKMGTADVHSPFWLGYEGRNFKATIKLDHPVTIHQVGGDFLQSPSMGVFWPKRLQVFVSNNGKTFSQADDVSRPSSHGSYRRSTRLFTVPISPVKKVRYVRVVVENVGVIPSGMPAAGRKAWLFVDELVINPSKSGTKSAD